MHIGRTHWHLPNSNQDAPQWGPPVVQSSLPIFWQSAGRGHASKVLSTVSWQPQKRLLHKQHHLGEVRSLQWMTRMLCIIILHQQQAVHVAHNIPNTMQREMCVWTPKGRKWWGQSPLPHHLQVYTLHGCDEKVYYNDLLKRRSVLREVLSLSAFPMFNKKASQPSSLKTSKFLLLARLLSTSSQPLSSCGKGTGISKTSALQRVGGEVRINMWVYVCVCCVWAHVYAYTCMCVTSELLRNWKFTLKVRHRDAQ